MFKTSGTYPWSFMTNIPEQNCEKLNIFLLRFAYYIVFYLHVHAFGKYWEFLTYFTH